MHGGHVGLGRSHRGQSCSYRGMWVPARDWSAVRPSSRASLAPTVEWVYLQEIGWLSGRLRGQASLLQGNVGTCKRLVGCQAVFAGKPRSYSGMWVPARDWSAVRPSSRAASLLQWNGCTCKRDWSAVRPSSRASLAPTVEWVYLQEIGWLSGRLRGQASLLQGVRCTRFALHHSSGRALARLQLLILIYPPLSGG